MLARRQQRLIRLLVGMVTLLVGAVGGGAIYTVELLRERTLASQMEVASMHAQAFENHLTQTLTLIALTLGHAVHASGGAEGERLRDALRHTPVLRSLGLLDETGRITASTATANLGLRVDTREFLPPVTPANDQLRIGAPWAGRDFASGRPTTPLAAAPPAGRTFIPVVWEPAAATPGGEQGLPVAALNPDWFLNFFLSNLPPELGVVDVLRYDRRLLFSTDPREQPGQLHELPEGMDLHREELGVLQTQHMGEPTLTAFRASRHHPLAVLVHLRLDAAFAKWRTEARTIGLSIGSSLLFVTALAALAIARLVRAGRREAEAEERMRLAARVFDTTDEGIMVTDAARRILSVNPAFVRATGYTQAEVLGHDPHLLASGRHDKDFYAAMWQAIHEHGSWSGEIVNRRKEGGLISEWLSISRVLGADGAVQHYIGVFTDLSARKAAEAELLKLSQAVEQSPSSVVITDLDGRIEYVNRAFTRVTGYTWAEAVGQNPRVLKSGQTPPELYRDLWETLRAGGTWEGDFVNRRKDGTLYWEHALIAPVVVEGQSTHYLAIKHDITELRQAEEALRQAKEAAEAANRAKSAFLANMSHELRTPLNAMLGHAQILQRDTHLTDAQRNSLETIHHSGDHLVTLINDVLDLAKVEAGRLDLVPGPCDPNALFRGLESLFRLRAREKGLAFRYEVGDLPALVELDERRLRQVVINLLGNAVKFTEQGEVALLVRAEGDPEAPTLFCEVRDSGIGIPPERIPGLFRPFQQEGSVTYRNQGTGLGLAISRALIAQMGGEIRVESRPGQGSRFTLVLPLHTLSDPGARRGVPERPMVDGYRRLDGVAVPLRILVVDDVAQSHTVLSSLLSPLGFEVDAAASGREGVERAINRRPDLILMDLVMPEMDGLEATRSILATPGLADTPIVAFSASAFPEDRENTRAAGCRDHLSKPLDLGALLECLARHLPLEWTGPAEEGAVVAVDAPDQPLAPEQREALLAMVRRGQITIIRRYLDLPEQLDDPNPRLARIRELAGHFDLKGIRALLEEG